MMSVLMSLIKKKIATIANNIISWFRRNYKLLAVIVITILTAFLFYLHNQLLLKKQEIDRVTNNYLYYLSLASLEAEKNTVLKLTLDEFKESKDSLVLEIKATAKKLKIKEKELQQVQLLEQTIVHDTTVIVRTPDFNVEIKPNNLTSILISRKDSLLTHHLDIRNSHSLFIRTEKIYKRTYKNWFIRLLHFDFKKRTVYKYIIHNSNELINVENTRIIELSK